ncbi:MAG: iron-containing alcohol dehydrogenase [Trueperaceae bacterium]|nr:iron-containing alcohol dehydrogenase [Trueperaceae bacterium]
MVGILSPGRWISERGAAKRVGSEVALFGNSALLVHGSVGYGLVSDTVRASLAEAGVNVTEVEHSGYCGKATVERIAEPARSGGYTAVIGVGGGRVLDVSKGVAHALDLPFVLIPTSPATCSASTTIIVDYTPEGAHIGGRAVQRPAAASLIDPELLAAAPDRLLVSGIADALAKAVEVRSATSRIPNPAPSTVAAFALCDALQDMLFEHSAEAVAGGPSRELIAEASVLWPGLIGTLAGEQARLAAAHSVHNALTILPGSHASMHGELVGFGILVQHVLSGDDAALEKTAAWFAEIGCPSDLEALGCGEYKADGAARERVLRRACDSVPLTAAFPGIEPGALGDAMARADAVAGACSKVA